VQTHESLTRHLLEEAYETVDAIHELTEATDRAAGDGGGGEGAVPSVAPSAAEHLEEELGDLLFQVCIHSVLAAEEGLFTLADVARGVHDKLVARHPHVFGEVAAADADAVVSNWEEIKRREKGRESVTDGALDALPALALASKLQRAARSVAGLDLPGFEDQRRQVANAVAQLPSPAGTAANPVDGGASDANRLVGELLWDLTDLGRQLGVDPEGAVRDAARRFRERVREAERH
jgi:uncharacterized protein YabN with tetrapyrrole methylase and pyrophosphatase domain